MDKAFDVKLGLRAFNKIFSHGSKRGEAFFLNGIEASSGFDGYTLTLSDPHVTLTIHFHNRFDFEFSKTAHYRNFVHKLEVIARMKS